MDMAITIDKAKQALRGILGLTAGLGLVAVAGCEGAAPDEPTWATDVAPILEANCVRCHTVPAIGGAPDGFRLDVYENRVNDDGRLILGAGAMASPYIQARIVDEDDPMPPEYGELSFALLSQRQLDILENWASLATLGDAAPRGDPRDGNQRPVMSLVDGDLGAPDADGVLTFTYDIRDPDRDIVVGELRVGDLADSGAVITRELHSGRGEVVWDVRSFPPGNYGVFAILDDGSEIAQQEVTRFDVPDTGNIAPTIRIANLKANDIIADIDAPFAIEIEIQDPDSLATDLSLQVTARLGVETVDIPVVTPLVLGTNIAIWDTTAETESFDWVLEAEVTDGDSFRIAQTGEFIVSHRTTTETFDSIANDILFGQCAYCHPGAAIPGLDHDFSGYSGGDGPILGAYDVRGEIFRRAVRMRNMPPVSSGARLSDEEVRRLEEWLLAGAPEL